MFSMAVFAKPRDVARFRVVVMMSLNVLCGAAMFARFRHQLSATDAHSRRGAAAGFQLLPRRHLSVRSAMLAHVSRVALVAVTLTDAIVLIWAATALFHKK